jgi:hypothetical protein
MWIPVRANNDVELPIPGNPAVWSGGNKRRNNSEYRLRKVWSEDLPRFRDSRPKFAQWGESVFDYLEKEKGITNVGLIKLIYCLGDKGRQELLLSIFSFLRVSAWTDFCRERGVTKKLAKRTIARAIKDLRCAASTYRGLLASSPELGSDRCLGRSTKRHLSDLLENEVSFLIGQERIVRAAGNRPRPRSRTSISEVPNLNIPRSKLLLTASRKLLRAARSYRALVGLKICVVIAKSADRIPCFQVARALETEALELERALNQIDKAFNKKRIGKSDLRHLIWLQDFIKEFVSRWGRNMSPAASRTLSASDLADLIEAGKASWSQLEDSGITSPESIKLALTRFRLRKSNLRTCWMMRCRATNVCDLINPLAVFG